MIEQKNFRYRGPVESDKVSNMMTRTNTTLNSVIAKVKSLVENTDTISKEIISNAKRRGNS